MSEKYTRPKIESKERYADGQDAYQAGKGPGVNNQCFIAGFADAQRSDMAKQDMDRVKMRKKAK